MDINTEYEYSIKVLVLGDSSVGKTNFIYRFLNDEFKGDQMSTTGIDLNNNSQITINNKKFLLQLWDTAGQEKFNSVTKSCFNKVQGFIVMFDLTKKVTFVNVKSWVSLIKEECGNHIPILVVGNKNDLADDRQIDEADIKQYTEGQKLKYIETSPKTGDNIKRAVTMICTEITESANDKDRIFSFSLDSSKSSKKRKGKCC
jgi:small GTP-binding protein